MKLGRFYQSYCQCQETWESTKAIKTDVSIRSNIEVSASLMVLARPTGCRYFAAVVMTPSEALQAFVTCDHDMDIGNGDLQLILSQEFIAQDDFPLLLRLEQILKPQVNESANAIAKKSNSSIILDSIVGAWDECLQTPIVAIFAY